MSKQSQTFHVQNFGCRATQADGAALEADFSSRGLLPVGYKEADLVVVNTCTVTSEADRDARKAIRRVHRDNPAAKILVTGCYAQRSPDELSALDGVEWVVGNSHKTRIGDIAVPTTPLAQIAGASAPASVDYHGALSAESIFVSDIYAQRELLTAPVIDAGQDRSRPNVKVQDGCNNRCTFCIIPSVRGYSRSASADQIVAQIHDLQTDFPEIVLTGINLGRWGRDRDGRPRFTDLLEAILERTAVRKLRISSVEPMDWTQRLLELVAAEPRIAKHVHVPLQSGSDSVLKRMRRRYRASHYADRLERARSLMPHAGIGADVMVGFPGETDAEFEASRAFIESMPFTYLHVFTFSSREGTVAAKMPDQVPKVIKKERNRILRELADQKNAAFRASLVGHTFSAVTLDPRADGNTPALTDNFLRMDLGDTSVSARRLVEVEVTAPDKASVVAASLSERLQ